VYAGFEVEACGAVDECDGVLSRYPWGPLGLLPTKSKLPRAREKLPVSIRLPIAGMRNITPYYSVLR
jgi:hypothetical protein